MAVTAVRTEKWEKFRRLHAKAHEKYAWIFLFVSGLFAAIAAFYFGILIGTGILPPSDIPPGPLLRAVGIFEIGWGLLVMGIARFSYRRGDRWSWYVLWSVPIISAGEFISFGHPDDAIFAIIALLGLLLPIRKFFPRKQP